MYQGDGSSGVLVRYNGQASDPGGSKIGADSGQWLFGVVEPQRQKNSSQWNTDRAAAMSPTVYMGQQGLRAGSVRA